MIAGGKQQFNVYLDSDLVHATKRASIDRGQSLSAFVADALRDRLAAAATGSDRTDGDVSPRPILFVDDMRAALTFTRALGLRLRARSRNGRWAEVFGPHGTLGLHSAEAGRCGRVDLWFESHTRLETLAERLAAAGFPCTDIVDEGYGRSTTVPGPDGTRVQIDEVDNGLVT